MTPHNSDAGLPDGKGLPEPAMREINPYLGNGDPYGGKTHLEWFSADQMEAYATARVAASRAEIADLTHDVGEALTEIARLTKAHEICSEELGFRMAERDAALAREKALREALDIAIALWPIEP